MKRSALLAAKVLSDKSLSPHVAELLNDKSTMIRMQAMDCLMSLKPKGLGKYLLKLVRDPVWYARGETAKVLSQKKIYPDLLKELQNDPKASVRQIVEAAV